MIVRHIIGVLLGLICVGGCGSPTTPSSSNRDLSGMWSGVVIESPGNRQGTLTMTFEQSGQGFTGAFTIRFAEDSFNRAGSFHGVNGQRPFAVTSSADAADCPVGRVLGGSVMNMTWEQTGDTLLGTYDGYACFGNVAGRFEVTRQRPGT